MCSAEQTKKRINSTLFIGLNLVKVKPPKVADGSQKYKSNQKNESLVEEGCGGNWC